MSDAYSYHSGVSSEVQEVDGVEESEIPLVHPKLYPWPKIDILIFLLEEISEEHPQIDLLLLLTAETNDPFIEHVQLVEGKLIKVTEKYKGWRAGKLIWQRFWWDFLREESANDYGLNADELPRVELEYVGGNSPPKIGMNFHGSTIERHVENCMLAAWLGPERFRREVLQKWPDLDEDFNKIVGNGGELKKFQLGNKLKSLLGIRPSRIEQLVDAFSKDLEENGGRFLRPGRHFKKTYATLEKKWNQEWKERVARVEQIAGPDVYWPTDYNIFTDEVDENETKFCRMQMQNDNNSHWGTLNISYNPFVATWESLRGEDGTTMVRIFDYREAALLDELLYLNCEDIPNNELLNNTLLKQAATKPGKDGKKLKGGRLRERILAQRKMRLKIRSLHGQEISLKLDNIEKTTGTFYVSEDTPTTVQNKTTPRVERLLPWDQRGKMDHIKIRLQNLGFNYELHVEGKTFGKKKGRNKLKAEKEMKIKSKHLDNPEHKIVSQLDFLGRAQKRFEAKNKKGGYSDSVKLNSIEEDVKKWTNVEEAYLKKVRWDKIKLQKALEARKEKILSYKFHWEIFEEMTNIPITSTNVHELVEVLKERLLRIGDKSLYTRMFEQCFMMKQLRRVFGRLINLKKIHEKWWFVFWFHHRILQLRICDSSDIPKEKVLLDPAKTPFDKIPWLQHEKTIDRQALTHIYEKYIQNFYKNLRVPAGEKSWEIPSVKAEVEKIAETIEKYKTENDVYDFKAKYKMHSDGKWSKRVVSKGKIREEIVEIELVKRIIPERLLEEYFGIDGRTRLEYASAKSVAVENLSIADRIQAELEKTNMEDDYVDPEFEDDGEGFDGSSTRYISSSEMKAKAAATGGSGGILCALGRSPVASKSSLSARIPGPNAKQRTTTTWKASPLPMGKSKASSSRRESKRNGKKTSRNSCVPCQPARELKTIDENEENEDEDEDERLDGEDEDEDEEYDDEDEDYDEDEDEEDDGSDYDEEDDDEYEEEEDYDEDEDEEYAEEEGSFHSEDDKELSDQSTQQNGDCVVS